LELAQTEVLPDLLEQLDFEESLASVTVDGVYDTAYGHHAIQQRHAKALILPHAGAVAGPDDDGGTPHPRKVNLST
jgi:hypothetical protein